MEVIFRAETLGGKYALQVSEEEDGTFTLRGFVNGAERSASVGWKDLEKISVETIKRIRLHKLIDEIDLRVIKQDTYSWGESL